jgi:hypothetical protein
LARQRAKLKRELGLLGRHVALILVFVVGGGDRVALDPLPPTALTSAVTLSFIAARRASS